MLFKYNFKFAFYFSISHHIFNYALAVGLANKGHNVTYFSGDLDKNPPPNLHNVHFDELYEVQFG